MARNSMDSGYKWTPILDYENDPATLAPQELDSLAAVWETERSRLADSEALSEFNRKLHREWAIETGLIERVYDFDRGVTELLIERGIDATLIPPGSGDDPERIASMIQDHEAAIEYVFAFVKDERTLSTSYIKELHQLLTQNQETAEGRDRLGNRVRIPLLRGDYKKRPNNPIGRGGAIHEYCPPEQVASEMDQLIEMHLAHEAIAPEVEAAWLHHRFTQIHPFQDGNGRVARALATLVLVKARRFPLVVRSKAKGDYLGALQAADCGDLKPLVGFFAEIQQREFVRALGLSREVEKDFRAEDLIRATRRELEHRRDGLAGEWNAVKDQAEYLRQGAEARMNELKAAIETNMGAVLEHVQVFVDGESDHGERSHYFRQQIVAGAQALDYFANLESYRAWVRLVIHNANQSQILLSFHGIGREFRGVLACSAVFFQRVQTDREERETSPAQVLARSLFQINYREDLASTEERFRVWLEECLVTGLSNWRSADL